jgi:hypothetical protein
MVDWIVCLGAERPVFDMRVDCPRPSDPAVHDAEVDVEDCLNCRHLLTTPVDRMPRFMCDVDWTADSDRNVAL